MHPFGTQFLIFVLNSMSEEELFISYGTNIQVLDEYPDKLLLMPFRGSYLYDCLMFYYGTSKREGNIQIEIH